jgi:predicted nucleotidyltransferase
VDLLVTFEPGYTPGLEFFGMGDEFAAVLGHPVDLFTRSTVEATPNLTKRRGILAIVVPLHAA